jgi:hypothetical protein
MWLKANSAWLGEVIQTLCNEGMYYYGLVTTLLALSLVGIHVGQLRWNVLLV